MSTHSRSQAGATLVELVISIVIITISVTGVLLAFTTTVGSSADIVREQQASAIAQAYLEEILLHDFQDPAGGETGGAEAGEVRATFDDVQDYAGLVENPPRDQTGAAIGILGAYTASVAVVATGALGPGGAQVPIAQAFRVDVTVTAPGGVTITMSGFRAL